MTEKSWYIVNRKDYSDTIDGPFLTEEAAEMSAWDYDNVTVIGEWPKAILGRISKARADKRKQRRAAA